MACLGCEERAKLLAEARRALHSGDREAVARILKDMFGTVVTDFSKLKSITFKTKEASERFTLKDIVAADPNDSRPEHDKALDKALDKKSSG